MKLNYKNTFLVGFAFMTISLFWSMYDFNIPLILKGNFGIGDYYSGYIMAADNVIALFLLPLLGTLSDRTHTKIGRRMPFIIFGTLGAVAAMMTIPYSVETRQLVLFMILLAFVLLLMATYRSPAVALMPDITPKPLRSKGNAVINLMGAVGGLIFYGLNIFLAPDAKHPETANYWPSFAAVAAFMLVGMIVLVLTINEPKLVKKMRLDSAAMGIDPEEAQETKVHVKYKLPHDVRISMVFILASIALWFFGYNAVSTAFSKYTVFGLGMDSSFASGILITGSIAAMIAYIPIGLIASKVGRKKTIMIGIVVLTFVFATAFLYKAYSPLMYVSFAFAGIAWAAINVNSLPMVLEMSKGADVGRFTGFYYTASMAAQIVTPIASGWLLEHVGYWTLFPYGAIFVALAFVTMLVVRHGDSKPIPKKKLEALDTGD
jgi:MFS family permease